MSIPQREQRLSCNCGQCKTCSKRIDAQVKRAAMQKRQRPETPQSRRMNAIAEEIWSRYADPSYYAPAAERFRGFGATMLDRVVTL